ncbi:MAG: histidine phosphatase family protein [Desulfarculus sp.]|nr:histidine phosphatase family protein [Desulfarculus sp.]
MDSALKYTRIFLWRHPEVQGAKDGRYFGHTDVPLTRRGKQQVVAVLRRMAGEKLNAVYASDLQRARLLAETIARRNSPRRKVEVLEALRELNLGAWEGMSFQEIADKFAHDLAARQDNLASHRIPEGESLDDLAARVVPAFQQMVGDNTGGSICVISHAGVNRVFLAKVLGAPLERIFRIEQEYACLNIIDVYADGVPVVKLMNQPPNLEEE